MQEFFPLGARTLSSFVADCQMLAVDASGGFQMLVQALESWRFTHQNSIGEIALVRTPRCRYLFLVTPRSGSYDRALEDRLTALEIVIAQDPQLSPFSLSTMVVPSVMLRDLALTQSMGRPLPDLGA